MSDQVQWRPTRRHQNYEVSDDGRVRNAVKGNLLTGSPNNSGYLTVSLGKRLPGQFIHTLVAEAFVPGYDVGLDVDHKDGNKQNNRADNLQWCTRSENIARAFDIGLAHGHKGPNAGTPPKKVMIVETGEQFDSQADCARAINGSVGAISQCVNGLRSKHKGYHFRRVDD